MCGSIFSYRSCFTEYSATMEFLLCPDDINGRSAVTQMKKRHRTTRGDREGDVAFYHISANILLSPYLMFLIYNKKRDVKIELASAIKRNL